MNSITAGRLLRSNTRGCIVGCHISQSPPPLGAMVYIPLMVDCIFGLIYDIHIDDDGLVRQLAASDTITEEVIQDNRLNRNTPIEMSILFIGSQQGNKTTHLLPSAPPLSLDKVYVCSGEEMRNFALHGHFGYFRYILAEQNAPTADLIAIHTLAVYQALPAAEKLTWKNNAITEIITLLRDDHAQLSNVLGAMNDAFSGVEEER